MLLWFLLPGILVNRNKAVIRSVAIYVLEFTQSLGGVSEVTDNIKIIF